MNDIIPSKGWQDGELLIIPHHCAILDLKADDILVPIYIYAKTIRILNCPYDLSIGKDINELLYKHEGKLPVRCLLHNNDLMIINADKEM